VGFTGATRLQKALAGKSKKPTSMTEWEWEDLDAKALEEAVV
jgi:hypothetical protein